MSIPILLVTGALGAGKTTLINRLLSEPKGRRLAAVVNDFGAIDIDAVLLSGVSDAVISLKNGCICCSLQMDLLSTLSMLLRRVPAPDGIVIEASGVSNPLEIIQVLKDPVIWRSAALDAVVTVVDAPALVDQPDRADDPLWRAQLQAADFVALSKTDLLGPADRASAFTTLRPYRPDRLVYETADGCIPAELLFSAALHHPSDDLPKRRMVAMPTFQTVSWTATQPLMLDRFQAVIGRFGAALVRAKGTVRFADGPGASALFQLVGTRATISQAPAHLPSVPAARLVFIARSGALDEADLLRSLENCLSMDP